PGGVAAGGHLTLAATLSRVLCFAYYCIAVGAFEEIVFRGIALPCCLAFFKGRFRAFWAAALGSAIFALCHLVNLVGGNAGEVFMQVGYSFLVGGMCAIVYLLCPNVSLCALLHALFDFGGFMATYLGTGMVWGALDITLTAVTAVAGTAYALWLLFVKLRDSIPDFWIKRPEDGADGA
ncbi:MAG: CPBP family intramembrane metalloprotease, partial [Clostridiales bacterium]|nr:CPBP family intramembrane metalloprotease [Clostridiales bacterium]